MAHLDERNIALRHNRNSNIEVMKKWKNILHNEITLIQTCFAVSAIISLVFLFFFCWGRSPFHFSGYLLESDVVGQYGDFVGGVFGTIISVLLLYFTFRTQHRDVENHMKVYKEESLNKLFFHMIELYNTTLDRYVVDVYDEGKLSMKLHGKEALHYQYEQLYESFQIEESENRTLIRKNAVSTFQSFYANTQDFSPIFFRTVYGILSLLNTSDRETEQERIRLMKVLRSQLTSTELIMLRYNAMTKIGSKSTQLLNRFNMFKHLPPMELLEYKVWSLKMTLEERQFTNQLLMIIKQNIKKSLKEQFQTIKTYSYSNNILLYNTHVNTNVEKSNLRVCIYIRNGVIASGHSLIKGILKLSSAERISLLHQFMLDIFVPLFSNIRNMSIEDIDDTLNGKWTVRISTKNNKPLLNEQLVCDAKN